MHVRAVCERESSMCKSPTCILRSCGESKCARAHTRTHTNKDINAKTLTLSERARLSIHRSTTTTTERRQARKRPLQQRPDQQQQQLRNSGDNRRRKTLTSSSTSNSNK